jgi:RimJ/RimL family protein N-acetyltransferase
LSEPAAPAPAWATPFMATRRVRLRLIAEGDQAFLYSLMSSPHAGGRVRFAGATPSPERVAASLWENVLAQFVVEGAASRAPLGLVAITSPNFRDGFAYISVLGAEEAQGSGLVMEGVLLGIHYAFCTWPFRKIYMEATDASYRMFRSGIGRYFTGEGRLNQHAFWNGHYMDVVILALYRETWVRVAPEMARRLGAVSPHPD